MNTSSQSNPTGNLTRELVQQVLGAASTAGSRSLGLFGPAGSPSNPPQHCLYACLHGDPTAVETHGCPWLHSVGAGKPDPAGLDNGRCPRGFHVAARPTRQTGAPSFLLAVTGAIADRTQEGSADQVLVELESVSRALEPLGQLLNENEGLAEEVLRGYEQLNLIFDFTRQIARLTDREDVEKALLVRLGALLESDTVVVVTPNQHTRCYDVSRGELAPEGGTTAAIESLKGKIDTLRKTRAVAVHSNRGGRFVLGPLVGLDDRVDVVVAIRQADSSEFVAGDMLMIESILTFGGQLICNAEVQARLRRMSLESTRALVAAIDKKDHYTSGHSERVGYLARLVGQRMGVPAEELQILEMSGLLHDVGKIGIPEGILCKPGGLTNMEYKAIKDHPRMGYEILKPIASFGGVLDGVLYHHENPDGSGYPEGLTSDQIPLFARIIHVVDVFDALTSTRSYRLAFSVEQACEILHQEAGTKLDAPVVAVLLDLLPNLLANHPKEFDAVFSTEKELTNAKV